MTRTLRTHNNLLRGEVTLESENGKSLYYVKDSFYHTCESFDSLEEANRVFDLTCSNLTTLGYSRAIKANGLKITQFDSSLQFAIVTAYVETDRGPLTLVWGENGCGKLGKPNGSQKWYYNKTAAQLNQLLRTTIEANTEPARK